MKPLAAATGYLVTVACIAVAGVARWLFDPWLGDHLPFATFFVSVAAAWLGGLRPALLATLLGFLLAEYFFVPPRFSFLDTSGPHRFGLAMYFMVCFAFAAFGEAMRHAQLQSELRRERLRTTLASIGDAVITTDTEGRITNLNAVAESLTGWKNDEAAGQPLETVFHIVNENTRKPVDNPVTRALREGVIVGLANHTVLIAKDGTQRPIDDSAAPIQDEQGKVAGVVLIFRDITERKRAAEELARSHRFLERVAQATPDMIFVYDLIEERNVYINRSLETTLGYTVEQLESFPGDLTARMVHPDDLASVRQFQRRFDTAEDGEVLEHEHRSRHADGSYRWLLAHATVFQRTAEGRAKEIIGVATDITARKRAEEELRRHTAQFKTLLNEVPLGVYLVDGDFRIRHVNPSTFQVFGDIPDLIGRDFGEVIHILWPKAYADEIVQLFRHTLETGAPYMTPERIEERLDRGVTEIYQWQINRIPLPEGGYGVGDWSFCFTHHADCLA